MLKVIKSSILNTIQVDAEVNAALKENTLVVVTKRDMGGYGAPVIYDIYAGQGKVEGGEIKED